MPLNIAMMSSLVLPLPAAERAVAEDVDMILTNSLSSEKAKIPAGTPVRPPASDLAEVPGDAPG